MAQTNTSKPALINGAAKDDTLDGSIDNTFTLSDLLGNDPGGANKLADHFFFGIVGGTNPNYTSGQIDPLTGNPSVAAQRAYLAGHGITFDGDVINANTVFTIGVDATDIDYMVQIGNKGTWSVAHVDVTADVPEPVTQSLHETWDFEAPHNKAASVVSYSEAGSDTYLFNGSTHELSAHNEAETTVDGWTINNGSVEVVTDPYFGTLGNPGPGESQWVDTQGVANDVPTGIDMSVEVDLGAGVHATVSLSVAAELFPWDAHTSESEQLDIVFNGVIIDTITVSDFGGDWHNFHKFNVDVVGAAGLDTLQIVSHDGDGNIGFAIDNISINSVNDWII